MPNLDVGNNILPEVSNPITEETSGIDATGMYDDLDCKIVDALTVDPKLFWSSKQRRAVRNLIHSYTEAAVREARIDEALKARDCIIYDEAAIDKIDERIWQLKGEINA